VIAGRLGAEPERWEEDGLGQAIGMFVQLPSGRVILIREVERAPKYLGAEGPTILADVGDLALVGSESMFTEVLQALELSDESVKWRVGHEAQRDAVEMLRALRSRQASS
jgi:hypothetical protein